MATITVTNLNDGGAGSLRAALVDAQAMAGADTIVFAPNLSGGTINLSARLTTFSGEVTVNGDINGDGVPDLAVGAYDDDDGGLSRGGVVILFDRWFGTFEPERDRVEYGIATRQPHSANFLFLNFHEFLDMWRDVLRPGPLFQRLAHLYRPPEWDRPGPGRPQAAARQGTAVAETPGAG